MKHTKHGILLTVLIAIIAWYLGKTFSIIGAAVFAITIGIILRSTLTIDSKYASGINFSSKRILKLAIILLGFNMNLYQILKVGSQSLLIIIATLSAAFVTAYFIGKLLKTPKNTTILISVGTAICGGSAIAATAPVINAKDDEISYSISTIFLFNILAVFLFPLIGRLLYLSDIGFGMWSGTAINDTSSVVAASYAFSDTAGDYATIVKLTRTLMIIPITLILSIITSKGNRGDHYQIKQIFPFFIIGFILASILNTFLLSDTVLVGYFALTGKFLIVVAMAAIGLKTDIKEIINKGYKPILLGLACWVSVASVSLIIQSLIGLL